MIALTVVGSLILAFFLWVGTKVSPGEDGEGVSPSYGHCPHNHYRSCRVPHRSRAIQLRRFTMSVNKEKWQELAEKYDTKAKWADALLFLNIEDHEDLISALIELDPQDLAGTPTGDIYVTCNIPPSSAGKVVRIGRYCPN